MEQEHPRVVTVATMNIRHDADRWPERRPLLSEGFRRLRPDVIGLQEVTLEIGQTSLLRSDLSAAPGGSAYSASVEPKSGDAPTEGIGCLTRLPIVHGVRIELPGGRRIAQALEISVGDTTIDVVNTHLHNEPADSEEIRAKQSAAIMEYIEAETARSTAPKNWVLMGDFNASPDSETVQRVLKTLKSAYPAVHGAEPPHTYPTPLAADDYADPSSYKCIDYIFVSPFLRVLDIQLIFTEPHPRDPSLLPSDHYGLLATISLPDPRSP